MILYFALKFKEKFRSTDHNIKHHKVFENRINNV